MSSFEAAIPFPSAEMREKPDNIFKKIINKIKSVRDAIVQRFNARGNKLAQMTDDALVDVAKETIADADSDGERTAAEEAEIKEAVETVVVQGAMEEAGAAEATRVNPILRLKRNKETEPDLNAAITDLNENDVALPTGEKVSDLADAVIERAEAETTPRVKLGEKIQSLLEQERTSESKFRPRTEIICDRNHIENQRINIIDRRDRDAIELNFKLRNTDLSFIRNGNTATDTLVHMGTIGYNENNGERVHSLASAYTFQKGSIKVSIAAPNKNERTAMGLVKIEAPANMSVDRIEETVASILKDDLKIPDALSDVSEKSENLYKASMYVWNNKLDGQLSPEQAARAESLQRKEVSPGYSTFVDEGRHEEYLKKYGDLRAVHHLNVGDAEEILDVFSNGLLSSSERYSRGVFREGMSTIEDFQEGGADSVFTRVLTEEWRKRKHGSFIIFKPELFDRTDWYCYKNDRFGSTEEETFKHRLSPDDLMEKIANDKDNIYRSNELMFRTGIGANYIEAIEVDDNAREKIISELKAKGVNEFDGRPIESVIIARHQEKTEQEAKPIEPKPAQPTEDELNWMMYGYGNQPIAFPDSDKDNDKKEA